MHKCKKCVYLDHTIKLDVDRLNYIFKGKIPNSLELDVFNKYVIYRRRDNNIDDCAKCQPTTGMQKRDRKNLLLDVVSLHHHIKNKHICLKAKVTNIIEKICSPGWSWAGHIT